MNFVKSSVKSHPLWVTLSLIKANEGKEFCNKILRKVQIKKVISQTILDKY